MCRTAPAPAWAGVSFPELHLRTYVEAGDVPGLFLFSVEVGSRPVAALARRVSRIPYHPARMRVRPRGTEVRYESHRRGRDERIAATYAPDREPFYPKPASFAHWLLTRERLFSIAPDGRVVRTDITTEPGPIQPARATVEQNNLPGAAGVPWEDTPEPRLH
jgi:hypothetical protein